MCIFHGVYSRSLLIHINSLWPSEAIWQHRSGTVFAQVMACCLMSPSYILNHFFLYIKVVLCHSHERNFTWSGFELNSCHMLVDYIFNITSASPRNQWIETKWLDCHPCLHPQPVCLEWSQKKPPRLCIAITGPCVGFHLAWVVLLAQVSGWCVQSRTHDSNLTH